MHFMKICNTYVRLESILAFRWEDETLKVFFSGKGEEVSEWDDPNGKEYRHLMTELIQLGALRQE